MNKESPLRAARLDARLTLRALADAARVHPSTLSRYETGALDAPRDVLRRIASRLRVSLRRLTSQE